MNLKRHILIILTILAFASANAEIVTWSISPNYEKLLRYSKDMYLFQNNNKWGIIKAGNHIILPASYDFITPFVNGYALAGSKEGNKYLLESIIAEDSHVSLVNDKYYLPNNYQYFSEDKLAVSNKNGKYGYINTLGDIVVKCQFDNALPFKEGYAPVKQGNYMKFISENYDRNASRNTLIIDFHYGEMTAAGCFSNGLAPVAYNTDFALINENGQKVRKLKEADFKQTCKTNNMAPSNGSPSYTTSSNYEEYSENGKLGLKQGDNIIVTPQFDIFGDKYSDGNILATLKGKQGVLRVNDGDVSINHKVNGISTSELEIDKTGKIQPIVFDCSIPQYINNYKIFIDDGSGNLIDITTELSRNRDSCSITVSPSVAKGAEECKTRIVVENDGIVLTDNTKTFSLSYPIKLRITPSKPSEVWADENGNASTTVYAIIYNDSNKSVTLTANWSNGKRESLTIPAHSSKKSINTVTQNKIQTKTTKTYTMTLNTGDKSSTSVTFHPFW